MAFCEKCPLQRLKRSIDPELLCCINETLLHLALHFFSLSLFIIWFLAFSLIQPSQRGCVQLSQLFPDCAEEKTPLHPFSVPPVIQQKPPLHTAWCCTIIIIIITQNSPFLTFSVPGTFIKSFLDSQESVTRGTVPFNSGFISMAPGVTLVAMGKKQGLRELSCSRLEWQN